LDVLSIVVGGSAVRLCGFAVTSDVTDALRGSGIMRSRNSFVGVGRFVVSSGRGAVRGLGARMSLLCVLGSSLGIVFGWKFVAFKGGLASTKLFGSLCRAFTCGCGHVVTH
jgi:hypothetical protein